VSRPHTPFSFPLHLPPSSHLQCHVLSVQPADLLLQGALLPQQLLHSISQQTILLITTSTQAQVLLGGGGAAVKAAAVMGSCN